MHRHGAIEVYPRIGVAEKDSKRNFPGIGAKKRIGLNEDFYKNWENDQI
jgi:hypothetical protein